MGRDRPRGAQPTPGPADEGGRSTDVLAQRQELWPELEAGLCPQGRRRVQGLLLCRGRQGLREVGRGRLQGRHLTRPSWHRRCRSHTATTPPATRADSGFPKGKQELPPRPRGSVAAGLTPVRAQPQGVGSLPGRGRAGGSGPMLPSHIHVSLSLREAPSQSEAPSQPSPLPLSPPTDEG